MAKVSMNAKFTTVPLEPSADTYYKVPSLGRSMGNFYMKRVYYFHSKPGMAGSSLEFHDATMLSLAKTTSCYPLTSGRLRVAENGDLVIKCNDSGIRMFEASSNVTLEEWFQNEEDVSRLNFYDAKDSDYSISPLVVVQFTTFKCGSLAVGVSWSHVLADIYSMSLFIQTWAEAHRGLTILPMLLNPITVPTRNSQFNIADKTFDWPLFPGRFSDMHTKHFQLKCEAVKRILQLVETGKKSISPFQALCSVIWKSMCQAHTLSTNDETKLLMWKDGRKGADSSTQSESFGNALQFSLAAGEAGEIMSKGYSHIAEIIQVNLHDDKAMPICRQEMIACPSLFFCIWDSNPWYQLDFGWGKPFHVQTSVLPLLGDGTLFVFPSTHGGSSLNVSITLHAEPMKKLLQNQTLLGLLS